MKNLVVLLALTVTISACGSKSEKAEGQSEVNLIEKYLAVKDALVATDAASTKKAAEEFLKVSNNASLKSSLEIIAGSSDVKVQRQAFETLSINMYSFVKQNGTNTTLYKQYCPMAFNNKGAYWLASEEEVNNPYFGDMMLHCGSVQETIVQ